MWRGESTGKGKDCHIFLFKDKLLITRRRKSDTPTYECKTIINVGYCQHFVQKPLLHSSFFLVINVFLRQSSLFSGSGTSLVVLLYNVLVI